MSMRGQRKISNKKKVKSLHKVLFRARSAIAFLELCISFKRTDDPIRMSTKMESLCSS